ncbi:hypothetical protein X778_13050 [Pseudomonas aeruginosa VRFPA07]|nr:hypothetical protein X778_13050 [Pseudomonas aeruginosa VRFPA07]
MWWFTLSLMRRNTPMGQILSFTQKKMKKIALKAY